MILKAYWIGKSIVAAPDHINALIVIARHERAEKWELGEVRELTEEELLQPALTAGSSSVAEILQGFMLGPEPSAWSIATHGHGHLIRWHRSLI